MLTKNKISLAICLVTGCALLCVRVANAQSHSYPRTENVLEFSLMSLKESAKKIEAKNIWLKQETAALRNGIHSMENELEAIQQSKQQKINNAGQISSYNGDDRQEIALVTVQSKRLSSVNQDLENDMEKLEQQVTQIKNDKGEMYLEVSNLREEIEKISAQLENYQTFNVKNGAREEKQRIINQLEVEKRRLNETQKEYGKIKRKFERPINLILELEEKNNQLKKKEAMLESALKKIMKEEKKVLGDLSKVKTQNMQDMQNVLAKVKELRNKKMELESVLTLAKDKLGEKKEELAQHNEGDGIDLKKNLAVLKVENIELKEKMDSLKKSIESLGGVFSEL